MLIGFKLAVAWFEGNALIGGGVYSYSERRGNFNRKARDAPTISGANRSTCYPCNLQSSVSLPDS